jgi:hypothetical protein
MAKKDNNGYIGNPTLGFDAQGIVSRNKNYDTRFYTQYDAYANDANLMSNPQYVDTRPSLTQSITTGGGSGSLATASLSNGSLANFVIYNGGTGYPSANVNSITMSFSGGGGVDAGLLVNQAPGGVITVLTPLYSVQDIIIADPGGPYTSSPTLSISAPAAASPTWRPNVTAVASASITDGKVTSITIHQSGSNYLSTSWPTITVSGGGLATGGTHAVLVPVLRNGRGYTSLPTLTITSPTGTGAVISGSLIAGIDSIGVTNGGGGYSSPPTVQIQGAAESDTSASAVLSGNTVSTISVTSGSSRFSTAPIINISGGLPPLPTISDNQIAAWYGVYDNNTNFVGLQISTNGGGGYTVNWGDGTSNNYNSNVTASKQYTTASYAALTSSVYSVTDLYKPALITVTLSGSATSFETVNFNIRPTPPTGSLLNQSPSNWKSIKMAGSQITSLTVGIGANSTRLTPTQLEQFEYSGSNNIANFTNMFANCYSLVEVVSLSTTNATNMTSMFNSCYNLQKIPELNLTNTTTGSNIFNSCFKLRTVTLLNSQNVTNWANTFNTCINLNSINIRFGTGVTTYANTFSGCFSLKNIPPLPVTNCNTLISTFLNCYNLKKINFIGTTSNVTTFNQTFASCFSLESVPLTLDLRSCTNTGFMFNGCRNLKTVPIFTNTRQLTNISAMFQNCSNIVNVPWFDTINVTDATSLFFNCSKLSSIPQFNFSRNANFSSMFSGCSNLMNIPRLETSNGTNFSSMFSSCTQLKEIPWMNTSRGTNFATMFSSCASLLKVPDLDLGEATSTNNMFNGCSSLINIPFFNLSKVTDPTFMFNSCTSLTSIPSLNLSSALSVSSIFNNCNSLKYIGQLDTSRATNFTSLFNSCYSLISIPQINTSRGTNFTNTFSNIALNEIPALNMASGSTFTGTFGITGTFGGLRRIRATGMNASFDISNQNLDSVALNEIYTNVSSTGAGKTITVTGNWGTANDTPSIATSKGWGVTG